jgi:putative transcriptional regulator
MSSVDKNHIKNSIPYIKKLRHAAGWTQEELADKVGVSRQTISSVECGKMIPSKTLFLAIIGLFAVGSAFLPILNGVFGATGLGNIFSKFFTEKKGE